MQFNFKKYLNETKDELKLRNYSPKTLKSYLGCLKEYFSFLSSDKTIKNLKSSDKVKKF